MAEATQKEEMNVSPRTRPSTWPSGQERVPRAAVHGSLFASAVSAIRAYYRLAKPGMIYGNLVAAAAGFFLAARGGFNAPLFLATLVGLALVIGSGCVFNNYIDRDADARMTRTRTRALATGAIAGRSALNYGAVLGILGFTLLAVYVNLLAAAIAFFGWYAYVALYSILTKPRTAFATHVGALAGAVPPVAGYVAVTHTLDAGALILFVMLCFWQLPHFFAIALYRRDEYAAAGFPTSVAVWGTRATRIQMTLSIIGFAAAAAALGYLGYAGGFYLSVTLAVSTVWLIAALQGFNAADEAKNARRVFVFSLIVLLVVCFAMSIDSQTPGSAVRTLPTYASDSVLTT